jgi:hypothetical protein
MYMRIMHVITFPIDRRKPSQPLLMLGGQVSRYPPILKYTPTTPFWCFPPSARCGTLRSSRLGGEEEAKETAVDTWVKRTCTNT